PYLLYAEDESILFDPGPGYPLFRDVLLEKIKKICNPKDIRFIIVHHADPDLCALIPLIENDLSPNLVILAHSRTSLFLPYYGIRKSIASVGDHDVLILKNQRKIRFIFTPYLHFAGSMMSYDEETKFLFSSDVFGVLDKDWKLYATDDLLKKAKLFLESYTDSKEAILETYHKLKNLEIKKILPQHGSIIPENLVNSFIELLPKLEPAKLLKKDQSKEEKIDKEILQTIKEFLVKLLQKEIQTDSLEELIELATRHSASSLLNMLDFIMDLESKYGVRILKSQNIYNYEILKKNSFYSEDFINRIVQKFLGESTSLYLEKKKNVMKKNFVILFFDIRKFTSWSQNQDPIFVMDTLNLEIGLVAEIIQNLNGRINKVMGDGILAYFTEDHIQDALWSGIRIHHAIYKKNLLPAGVSLDYGEVILGDIGFSEKVDYSLIGNCVNRASRLNDITKKGEITISKEMFESLIPNLKNKILKNKYLIKGSYKPKPEENLIEYYNFPVIKYKD
ncbi:MAG: adenylate/guanylate cyclase domain-containing protein, partial [Leptonema sp. (in: bacteria)]